jgi:rare lipoprotein A
LPGLHIIGRVLRAHPALLGASLTCSAALTALPLGGAAAATLPSRSPAASPAPPGISIAPGGVSVPQLAGPALLPIPPIRVKLRIARVHIDVLEGSAAAVTGTLRPGLPGRTVDLQRIGRHGWRTIAHTITRPRGRFVLRYTPHSLLTERVRVLFAGDPHDHGAHRYIGRLSSYRLAGASWYGGGGSLACGGQLTDWTMGVANKTLPCGTLVTLRYGGRSVRVPVVDRGPYVAGREFDLTEATKRALGFEGVGDVWSTR